MDIQDWGAIGDFIGGIAVVVSLLYLAVQIRQNTRAVKLSTGHEITEEFRDMFALMAEHRELSELICRAATDYNSINGADKVRYYGLNSNFVRALEDAYIQLNHNALDHRHWTGLKRMMIDYARIPGFIEYWKHRHHWFSDEFQIFMEQEIIGIKVCKDIPLPGEY